MLPAGTEVGWISLPSAAWPRRAVGVAPTSPQHVPHKQNPSHTRPPSLFPLCPCPLPDPPARSPLLCRPSVFQLLDQQTRPLRMLLGGVRCGAAQGGGWAGRGSIAWACKLPAARCPWPVHAWAMCVCTALASGARACWRRPRFCALSEARCPCVQAGAAPGRGFCGSGAGGVATQPRTSLFCVLTIS